MRFKAERVELGAAILLALVVVGCVGHCACDLAGYDVSGASGADDGDVIRDSSRFREVVGDNIAGASVVAMDQSCNLVFNDDTCGMERFREGVDDVVVALVGEAGLPAGGLMDAVRVVGVVTVAAVGGASDDAKSELDDGLEGVRGDFLTKVFVGDREVDGTRRETGAADDTGARFKWE